MTKLSVITINFNNCNGLEKTIESVVSQTFSDFEYIIIDGNSTDGSQDIIKKHESKINYWISEKDNGIYDALNKGVHAAKGEYLLFLNSGDSFYSNNVVASFIDFVKNNNNGIIYGKSNILLDKDKSEILTPPETLDFNFWYRSTLNHQAVFTKKELFKKYGLFDLKYKICSDFDFFVKVFCADTNSFDYFDCLICNYDQSGFSAAPENFNKMLEERDVILKTYLNPQQLKIAKEAYTASLPVKQRLLNSIGERPLWNAAFKRVFSVYSRIKGNGG